MVLYLKIKGFFIMKINDLLYLNENELPLDNIVTDGGYCSIFQTIACIGDSLSSGEFEAEDSSGNRTYHDMFEYSWGQFIAKMAGIKVYNFSRGGMTAKEYMESFAESKDYFNKDKAAQAYIIALGVNDLFGYKQEVGSVEDIDLNDSNNNKDTFAGWYGRVIQKYKEIQPNARFFFVTMPREEPYNEFNETRKEQHAKLLYDLTKLFKNSYVIDLYKYAPIYDENFREKFYLRGHMNPAGYKFTAYLVASYINYIIKSNFKDFEQIGFIGHPQYDEKLDK